MHILGAIAFIAFCVTHVAFGIDTPEVMELKKDINYAKIKQAFPNTSDADLISRRLKLQSLNKKVISSIPKNSAPPKVIKNPKYEYVPGTPQDISVINQVLAPYLYEMDIVLTDQQLNEVAASARKKRKAISYPSYKWPTKANGVIPYFLAANLTAEKITVIQAAIKFWEDNTCLKFQLNATGNNSLLFLNGDGCYSDLGMSGGQQGVSIGDGCENMAVAAHEIAHALGFIHEQSRYDRDSFVTVNFANIQVDMEGQFVMGSPGGINLYSVPYDYGSVMHYASEDFAIDQSIPVLIAADPRYQQTMGQRRAPSFLDVLTMNRHYGCDALCASYTTVCQNGGYKDPNNCNQCKCPPSFAGAYCQILAPAENGVCGASLTATTTWQDLSATVGTNSYPEDTPTTCYWHLNSPPGTVVEVNLSTIGGTCGPSCYWNYVDILLDNDYTKTGIRHCCPANLPSIPYVSTTNKVPIIVYGNDEISFTIQYRYVDAPTTTTTTTSTTSTPTTTSTTTTPTTTTTQTTTKTSTTSTPTTTSTTSTTSTPTTTTTSTTSTPTSTTTTSTSTSTTTPITTSTTTNTTSTSLKTATPTTTSTTTTSTSTIAPITTSTTATPSTTLTTTTTTKKPTTTSTTFTTTTTTKRPTTSTSTTTTKKPTTTSTTSTSTTTTKKPTTISTTATTTTTTKKPTTTSTTSTSTTTTKKPTTTTITTKKPTTSTTTATTKKPTTTSITLTMTTTKKTTTSTTKAPTTTTAPPSACSIMDVDPNVRLSSLPRNYKVYGKVNDCAAKCAAETNFTCKGFVWKGPNSGCVLHGKLDLPVVMQHASQWFLVDLDCTSTQPCMWSVNATNIDPTLIGASMKAVNVQNHHQCQALCLLGVLQPKCRAYALTNDPFYADGYNCYLFPALNQNQISSAISGKFVLYHNQCY